MKERTALSTLIAAVTAIPLGILLGSSEKVYRQVEIRGRFLPLDAGLSDVPAVSGSVRRRRWDENLGRSVWRRAHHSLQCRLWRDKRSQDPPSRRQGDGCVAAAGPPRRDAFGIPADPTLPTRNRGV